MSSYFRSGCVAVLACCALALTSPAAAQLGTGSVTGSVRDSSGGTIPGATVTLTSSTKAFAADAVTNASGDFVFPIVAADTYVVRVKMDGFKVLERPDVIVHPGDRVAVGALVIEVGALEETVLVSGEAPMIQAQSGERSFSITREVVQNTAINARNINNLTFLAPGVVAGSVNGSRTNQNNFQIDGIGAMDTGNNGVMIQVNPEAVAEVKVLTSNYQAEYGRSAGAQISAVTKSGSSTFHGSLYGDRRKDDLNANSWINNREGTPKTKVDEKDYGYTFGGPVPGARSKVFFFVSEEFQPRSTSGTLNRFRLPTDLERQGDFSQTRDNNGNLFNLIRDASTGLPCTAADTRGCFQDGGVLGRIPKDRLYPVGMAILNMYPQGNAPEGLTQANGYDYQNLQGKSENPRRQDVMRFDWQPFSSLRLNGKVLQTGGHTYTPGQIPGVLDVFNDRPGNRTMSFTVDATLNAVTIFESTYGQSRNQLQSLPAHGDIANRTALGLSGFPYLYPNAMILPKDSYGYSVLQNQTGWIDNGVINVPPQFTWGSRIASSSAPPSYNFGQQNPNFGARAPWLNLNRTQDLVANLTRLMGRHTGKVGIYYTHNRKAQAANNSPDGLISFGNDANNPLDTGFGFANAALGVYSSYTQAARWIEGNYIYNNVEWFVQDNWKASNKLTLDYGVRFYWIQPQYDSFGLAANFLPEKYSAANAPRLYYPGIVGGARVGIDQLTGATVPAVYIGRVVPNSGQLMNGLFVAGQGIDKKMYKGSGILPAPRFGFAYDLSGDQHLVLRGGTGMFYNRERGDTIYQMVTNPPNAIQPTLLYGRLQDVNSSSAIIAPPALQAVNYNAKTPTTIPYTIGVQMALPWSSALDVSYVGSYAYNQSTQRNINAPNYGAAYLAQNQDPTVGVSCTGCAAASTIPGANALSVDFLRPYRGFGDISMVEWSAYSHYNSLQTSYSRRFRNGLSLLVNYTLGKAMGTSSADLPIMTNVNAIGAQRNDGNNRRANYAPLDIDRRHTLVSNFVWQLPQAHVSRTVDKVINDWQLSGVFRAGSGAPYTVSYSIPGVSAKNLTGAEGLESARVVITGDPGSGCGKDPYKLFNTAAFTIPQPGSIGLESGINYMRGCSDHTLDLSISRTFRVTTTQRLEVRFDAFNALNAVIFSARNATLNVRSLTDPTPTNLPYDASGNFVFANRTGFGAATNTAAPRTMQVLVRFQF